MRAFTIHESEYRLAKSNKGWVRFKEEDIQSVRPHYEDTAVTLRNGQVYLLQGRNYGV